MAPHPTKFTNLFRFFFSVSLADKIQLSSLPTIVIFHALPSYTGTNTTLSGFYNICYNTHSNKIGSVTLGKNTHLCDLYLVEECGDDEKSYGTNGIDVPKQVFANWDKLPEGWVDRVLSLRCWDAEEKFGYG